MNQFTELFKEKWSKTDLSSGGGDSGSVGKTSCTEGNSTSKGVLSAQGGGKEYLGLCESGIEGKSVHLGVMKERQNDSGLTKFSICEGSCGSDFSTTNNTLQNLSSVTQRGGKEIEFFGGRIG